MLQIEDPLVPRTPQHIDDMACAKTLTNPVDAGERFARLLGRIIPLRGIQTDVTVTAIPWVDLTEVAQQGTAAAATAFRQSDHGIELVQFDPFLFRIVSLLNQAAIQGNIAGAIEQQRLGRQTVSTRSSGLLVV